MGLTINTQTKMVSRISGNWVRLVGCSEGEAISRLEDAGFSDDQIDEILTAIFPTISEQFAALRREKQAQGPKVAHELPGPKHVPMTGPAPKQPSKFERRWNDETGGLPYYDE